MASMRDIKRRKTSIQGTQQITKAMKLVSTVKLQRARAGAERSQTYFDCTNFYFEIDREDDFRRKGPSKENRRDPIVGLGLLLDANQIPIGMKMYPGKMS